MRVCSELVCFAINCFNSNVNQAQQSWSLETQSVPRGMAQIGTNQCTTGSWIKRGTLRQMQLKIRITSNWHRCSSSLDTLQCLREVPFGALYAVAFEGLEWFAAVDGTFIKEYPQISITQGRLAKVPILVGSNTDEGVSFGTTGVDTDEDCIAQLICTDSTSPK